MPPAKKLKGAVPPAAGGAMGIEALPDEVLHHILGFLDAREAVRTCVLAQRWRGLWRSATSLRIERRNLATVREFLEHLLILRAGSPLHTFKLWFPVYEGSDQQRLNLWVRYALLCRVRVLQLGSPVPAELRSLLLHNLPLVSQHLRSILLTGAVLQNRTSDFSGCPSLEHLHLDDCRLTHVRKISSESLKFLNFTCCGFNRDQTFRTLICAPSLVALMLDDRGLLDGLLYRTPLLDSMPALQKAFVRLVNENADRCTHSDSGNCGHENCYSCYGIEHDNGSNCVLLKGLSEAENLTLIAASKTFIFKRDMKQCPTFSKLKTLVLNDHWCVAPDFHELTCILKRSPVLEKLTLDLSSEEPKHKLRIKGRWNPTEISAAISPHLKIVEVKCDVIDEKVVKVLKSMNTFRIRFHLDEMEILE